MTESEWLAATDPRQLFGLVEGNASNRKFVLFSVACNYLEPAYNPGHLEAMTKHDAMLIAAMAFADGFIEVEQVRCFWDQVPCLAERCREWAIGWADPPYIDMEDPFEQDVAPLIREVFGNPFRHIALDSSWRTTTTVSIARTMYDSRDFSPMPLLADALQDAGCENEDILNHCRSGGPHVRGCWVVDLILGKE